MQRFLTGPTAWKRLGRGKIRFWRLGAALAVPFRPMRPEAGARVRPRNYWSAMADTGENPSSLPKEVLRGVFVCPDAMEMARTGARRFVDWAWQAIARDGQFHAALSGGSTPREMYRLLATSEYRTQIDWPRVHLFWGDERAVPPDDPASNYGMTRRELLLRVPIPPN